jgi:hypothetical protein
MGLGDRLMKLEKAGRDRRHRRGSNANADLVRELDRIAERTCGEEMNAEWCGRQSASTIMAMCQHELGTAEHSLALWWRCRDLAGKEGALGKVASGLLSVRAEGLRAIGLVPDEVFAMKEPEAAG